MTGTRRARVRALAKINLALRVLGKRPDGYHELRTIFQTVSLGDVIKIAFTPARKTSFELVDDLQIPDNLVTRAAQMVMDASGVRGRVELRLTKRIPMGSGLGGGSSDAAAILLALPVLTGRPIALPKLCELGQQLGSDVPFFLLGGTAAGIGRGTELFPLPDGPTRHGLIVAPGVHVSTAEAYRRLSARLTTESQQNKIFSFQSQAWGPLIWDSPMCGAGCERIAGNDFETVVFEQHRELKVIKERLVGVGAVAAMMTGSGSALFGLFRTRSEVIRASELLGDLNAFRISFVSRARYRGIWWRALQDHTTGRLWPPPSRYAR